MATNAQDTSRTGSDYFAETVSRIDEPSNLATSLVVLTPSKRRAADDDRTESFRIDKRAETPIADREEPEVDLILYWACLLLWGTEEAEKSYSGWSDRHLPKKEETRA